MSEKQLTKPIYWHPLCYNNLMSNTKWMNYKISLTFECVCVCMCVCVCVCVCWNKALAQRIWNREFKTLHSYQER